MNSFAFLTFPDSPLFRPKPRANGLTFCLDRGVGPLLMQDILVAAGSYIDNVRLGATHAATMPEVVVREKAKICKEHEVEFGAGGVLYEFARLQGVLVQMLERCKSLGFESVEMSENIVESDECTLKAHIAMASRLGLTVYFEYGPKYPEAGLDVDVAARKINSALEAGARKAIVERSIVDLVLPSEPKKLLALAEKCGGPDNLVFEAGPRRHEYVGMLLRLFGPFVNLGNITFHPEDGSFSAIYVPQARLTFDRDVGFGLLTTLQSRISSKA